jgi:hypothetical protein
MAENIIGKDLVSLFRGQPMFGPTANQALSSYASDKMLSGKFFTPDLNIAKSYATNSSFPSIVKEMKVPQNVLDKAYDFKNRLANFSTKTFADINMNPKVVIANNQMLRNYKPSINIPATLSSNFYQGLGFLKNNAFKTLAMLGSLPAQAGIYSLTPTPANMSEINMGPVELATLMQAEKNKADAARGDRRGGYQSSWGGGGGAGGNGGGFMGGSGTSAEMGSFANGGIAILFGKK